MKSVGTYLLQTHILAHGRYGALCQGSNTPTVEVLQVIVHAPCRPSSTMSYALCCYEALPVACGHPYTSLQRDFCHSILALLLGHLTLVHIHHGVDAVGYSLFHLR